MSTKKVVEPLALRYDSTKKYEICLDEVGRGPLFGRLYTAAVVLPVDFVGPDIKDSKKFSSKVKIRQVADYIRTNALVWHIDYQESTVIDEINILQAVYRSMHECIRAVLTKLREIDPEVDVMRDVFVLVDGDRFKPYCTFDEDTQTLREVPHTTIEGGDAKYMGIAAASIIAKVAHDAYIHDLCTTYPELVERYHLDKNVGYGTAQHLAGIQLHGITQWHRKTYGRCKDAKEQYIHT
jgi:ribonuclease HII